MNKVVFIYFSYTIMQNRIGIMKMKKKKKIIWELCYKWSNGQLSRYDDDIH